MHPIVNVHFRSNNLKKVLRFQFRISDLPSELVESTQLNLTITTKNNNGTLKEIPLSGKIAEIKAGNIYTILDDKGEKALYDSLFELVTENNDNVNNKTQFQVITGGKSK
ncbi:hypothetical protein [Cytobacillus oceanisediminis]|uniref:hypothetical protein n=1 Tax=Cytobacillus oceanisediminis TaxID=665099 RepID=UPI00203C4298|nr:hypothetical protein [Cytobacillus oceanisediminis]MCM3405482.1 hypothetical protein [Cytobacillus oceanisediminis]